MYILNSLSPYNNTMRYRVLDELPEGYAFLENRYYLFDEAIPVYTNPDNELNEIYVVQSIQQMIATELTFNPDYVFVEEPNLEP